MGTRGRIARLTRRRPGTRARRCRRGGRGPGARPLCGVPRRSGLARWRARGRCRRPPRPRGGPPRGPCRASRCRNRRRPGVPSRARSAPARAPASLAWSAPVARHARDRHVVDEGHRGGASRFRLAAATRSALLVGARSGMTPRPRAVAAWRSESAVLDGQVDDEERVDPGLGRLAPRRAPRRARRAGCSSRRGRCGVRLGRLESRAPRAASPRARRPAAIARWLARAMAGPSAVGSLKGTPSSRMSAPASDARAREIDALVDAGIADAQVRDEDLACHRRTRDRDGSRRAAVRAGGAALRAQVCEQRRQVLVAAPREARGRSTRGGRARARARARRPRCARRRAPSRARGGCPRSARRATTAASASSSVAER